MKTAILNALFYSVVVQGQKLNGDVLSFQVTYRDFLPAGCFFTAFTAGDAEDTALRKIELDSWKLGASTPPNPRRINACARLTDVTEWQKQFQDGDISGHPDFEPEDQAQVAQDCRSETNAASGGLKFPAGFCAKTGDENVPIVSRELKIGNNGLGKPQYCQEGAESRCGVLRNGVETTQTQNKWFQLWYEDDTTYNRRTGQRLDLKRTSATKFRFDSDSDSDAPEASDVGSEGFFPLTHLASSSTIQGFKDKIDLAPIWPLSSRDSHDASFQNDKFWFTTELHGTFEFASSGMEFTFSGDDDFFAYVNDKLVIDFGGIHSKGNVSIDLNAVQNGFSVADFLGLVPGNVYTIDIFHAERKLTGSNFEMETSLLPTCNVIQSGSVKIDMGSSFNKNLFVEKGISSLQSNSNSFFLTSNSEAFQSNHLFTKDIVNLENGFTVSFDIVVNPTDLANLKSEGFAFVVQAEGVEDLPSSSGDSMNFEGISKSFAVVFDFCADESCSAKTVSVHFPDDNSEGNRFSDETRKVFDSIVTKQLERGEVLPVEIIYYGSKPDFLEVFIDGSLYLRQRSFNVADVLGGTGGFMGFTASTSSNRADIKIQNFKIDFVDFDPVSSALLFDENNFAVQTVVADGKSLSDGFKFQTKDACTLDVSTGGALDDIVGVFVEDVNASTGSYFNGSLTPANVDASVVDNGDGSYSFKLQTVHPGLFSLHFSFGSGCDVTVSQPSNSQSSLFIPTVAFSGNGCFSKSVLSAVEASEVVDVDLEDPNVDNAGDDEGPPIVVIVGSAAGLLVVGMILGAVLTKYRRQWQKEKGFIDDGVEFRRVANTKFAGNEEYNLAGKKLLEQQATILELKAKGNVDGRTEEIQKLSKENTEMKTILRENAKKEELLPTQTEPQRTAAKKFKKGAKLDF